MINIIKHGNRKRIICPSCSCIFTYEKEDVVIKDFGKNEICGFVTCPDCGEECHSSMLGR